MLKRCPVAFLALCLCPGLAAAQALTMSTVPSRSVVAQAPSPPSPAPLDVGLKGGLNVASLSETTDLDSVTGLLFGAFLRRNIDESLSIQPEFLYSQQGARFRDVSLRLNYLQIPILGRIAFPRATTIPFVVAGPAIGVKLGASVEEDGDSEDISDEVSGGDFSLVFGGGIERDRLSFEARYAVGLKDVDTGNDVSKNRVFSIIVAYRLR